MSKFEKNKFGKSLLLPFFMHLLSSCYGSLSAKGENKNVIVKCSLEHNLH
jgi:hypothetical protein